MDTFATPRILKLMSERICPHCKNPITDEDALLCHFCGESLGRRSSGVMGKLSLLKWIVCAAILVMFALMMIK